MASKLEKHPVLRIMKFGAENPDFTIEELYDHMGDQAKGWGNGQMANKLIWPKISGGKFNLTPEAMQRYLEYLQLEHSVTSVKRAFSVSVVLCIISVVTAAAALISAICAWTAVSR